MSNESIINQISSADNSTVRNIPVSLSNQLISLLSEQLYQSPLKAIEELVVNSYDAGANECKVLVPISPINIDTDRVIVYDDGIGMDVNGLTTLWSIGGSGKRNESDTINGRKIIGKFGIGLSATLKVYYTNWLSLAYFSY